MKKRTWFLITISALVMSMTGCTGADGDGTAQEELRWCYAVPVETVLSAASAEEIERFNANGPTLEGIYCGVERPAEAIGDALLPMYVDRQAFTLRLEGGLNADSGGIVVKIDGLEPGVWTEHKKVYNLSDKAWNGWQVTMGNAQLVTPELPDSNTWVSVNSEFATAMAPAGYQASVNVAQNAVFFGSSLGPSATAQQVIAPGEYIEKVWSYIVHSDAGKPTGNARMCHNRYDPGP